MRLLYVMIQLIQPFLSLFSLTSLFNINTFLIQKSC